jgi:hypothetical protein
MGFGDALLPKGFDGVTAIDRELFNIASKPCVSGFAFQVSGVHSLPPASMSGINSTASAGLFYRT